jgi:methyl-accepting chemotaxis protein
MTMLGRLKLGFRVVVVAVVVLTCLNIAELVWIDRWQGDTKQTVENSQAAFELTQAVDQMTSVIGDLSDSVFAGGGFDQLQGAFAIAGTTATKALTSLPTSAEVQTLRTQLDDYVQAGVALLGSTEVDPTNILARRTPVSTLGNKTLLAAKAYQETSEAAIAAKLDRLGFVGMICLIITAVVGAASVIGGALISVLVPRKIGHTLNEAATGISSSAAELMAVASQVAASAAQTAASTNETTVTVEEVKQTAMLTNEKASQVTESVEGAHRTMDSGLVQVEGTITGIERMHDAMDVVFETISRLSERALAAGDVIAAVNDLAEQSNLLSVNASIEAAKAGEHGRGFSVVAQEVKSLAEQSKQAVAQVRGILSEIQKASETAVRAAEQGRDSIEAGRRQSVEAGEVIQSLAEGASGVSQSAAQISASSRQQLAGMEQISQAIASINEAGNQSVAGTRQVEHEVRHLQDLAMQLKKLVQLGAPETKAK